VATGGSSSQEPAPLATNPSILRQCQEESCVGRAGGLSLEGGSRLRIHCLDVYMLVVSQPMLITITTKLAWLEKSSKLARANS